MGSHDISIKFTQANFHKCMTWLQNQGKDVESGQRHISMWVCHHEN